MGSYYQVFTEVRVGDEWICINREYPDLKRSGERCLAVTYDSGSRSYFHETAEKLEELGYRVTRNYLSKTLQDYYSSYSIHEEYFRCTVTDIKDMRSVIPKGDNRKEKHAFVHKNSIFAYESGELDDIYDYLNVEEYGKLSEKQKNAYHYYEWNDEMGWYKYFLEILEHADWQLYEWCWVNREMCDEVRIVCVTM